MADNHRHKPFGRLAHSLDDPVEGIFSSLLERLRDRFRSLFVRGVFKKASEEMLECHFTVVHGAVFQHCGTKFG
jgi:hypothetical protein